MSFTRKSRPEMIVVTAGVEMLAREVEVGDAAAARLAAARSRCVRDHPMAVPPRAVVVPAQVVVEAPGKGILRFFTQDTRDECADIRRADIALQPARCTTSQVR